MLRGRGPHLLSPITFKGTLMLTPFSSESEDVQAAQAELEQLLLRSAIDYNFRQQLLTHPKQAMEDYFGRPVPASLHIRFIENDADATIVLPDYHGAALTEEGLTGVAGGHHQALPTLRGGLHKLSAWLHEGHPGNTPS